MATPATPEKMPFAGSREAPKFDQEKPGELLRFFKTLEEYFTKNHIVDAQQKKEFAGKYADVVTERDWEGMATYEAPHSWTDFKNEIISLYPEASTLARGSLNALERLCKENSRIGCQDVVELKTLKRKFQGEVNRIMATGIGAPPAIISNRELVKMALGCLEGTFRAAVINRMDTIEAARNTDNGRRAEDPYLLKDVWAAAEKIADGSSGLYAGVGDYTSTSAKPSALPFKAEILDEINERLAALQDTQNVKSNQLNSRIDKLEKGFSQIHTSASQNNQNRNNDGGRPYGRDNQNRNQGSSDQLCFHCSAPGHRSSECADKSRQFIEKKIKLDAQGRTRLSDGAMLPVEPGLSVSERIEKYWKGKTPPASVNIQIQRFDRSEASAEEYNDMLDSLKVRSEEDHREQAHIQLLQRESRLKKKSHVPMEYDSDSESEPEDFDFSQIDPAKLLNLVGAKKLKSLINTRGNSRQEDFQ